MTLPSTDIHFRQHGMLRIEIAAIVMLLIALAIVLVAHVPPAHQPGVSRAGELGQIQPAVNAGMAAPLLPPAVGQ